jgi:hypothetical protein
LATVLRERRVRRMVLALRRWLGVEGGETTGGDDLCPELGAELVEGIRHGRHISVALPEIVQRRRRVFSFGLPVPAPAPGSVSAHFCGL